MKDRITGLEDIRHEDDLNNFLYNRPHRYIDFNLDYITNIEPLLLKNAIGDMISYFQYFKPDTGLQLLFQIDSIATLLNKTFKQSTKFNCYNIIANVSFKEVIKILLDHINNEHNTNSRFYCIPFILLSILCIDSSEILDPHNKIDLSEFIIKTRKSETLPLNNIAKTLIKMPVAESNEYKISDSILSIFTFFNNCNNELEFKNNVPTVLYDSLIDIFNRLIQLITKYYKVKFNFNDVIDFIKKAQNPITEEEAFKASKFIRISNGKIILENLHIQSIDASLSLSALENNYFIKSIYFKGCYLDSKNYNINSINPIHFYHCYFDTDLLVKGKETVSFNECEFNKSIKVFISKYFELNFNKCIFSKTCNLNIYSPEQKNKAFKLSFEDCILDGKLSLENIDQLVARFIRTSIMVPFEINNIKFTQLLVQDLCFPSSYSYELKESQKKLYKALLDSGLQELADNLNLSKPSKNNYDEDAYQAAIAFGWLSPEFAAIYLNTSEGYLAKRRYNDKKHCVKSSVPYRGAAKGLKYPLEALAAYKANNWETLAKIREKMDFPNNVLKEREELMAEKEKKKQP